MFYQLIAFSVKVINRRGKLNTIRGMFTTKIDLSDRLSDYELYKIAKKYVAKNVLKTSVDNLPSNTQIVLVDVIDVNEGENIKDVVANYAVHFMLKELVDK